MSEKEMKMADVFKGKVVVDEIFGNRKQGSPRFTLSDSGVFRCGLTKEGLKYAAHSINQHDKHIERIKELENCLAELVEASAVNEFELTRFLGIDDYGESEPLCNARKLLEQSK